MTSAVAPVDGEFEIGRDDTKQCFESKSRPPETTRDTDTTETAILPPECETFAFIQESAVHNDAKNEEICNRKLEVYARTPSNVPENPKLMLPVDGRVSPKNELSSGAE
jgi:hypothetical protein